MRIIPLTLLCSLTVLGGCAELAATAIIDARAAHDAAYGYVQENHELRRDIRRMCVQILNREVDALIAVGDYEEARVLLRGNYPDLVTLGLVKRAVAASEGSLGGIGGEPFGCGSNARDFLMEAEPISE